MSVSDELAEGPVEPAPREGETTRRAILKAAEQLFVEHGYAATSTATVARSAGVTKSLIHHHFGSKRELWDAVKLVVMEEYGQTQRLLLQQFAPGLALIEASVHAYFRFLRDHPNVVRFWNWMSIEGDHECPAFSQWLMQQGIEMLEKAQRAGEVRDDVAPEYVLAQVCVLVRGWFIEKPILERNLRREASAEVSDEQYVSTMVRILLDGLRVR